MNNTKLYNLLKDFVIFVDKGEYDEAKLYQEFREIAKEIIFGGHFKVELADNGGNTTTDTFRIVDVEAYFFNEEKPETKGNDWIMYHRNYYSWSKGSRQINEDFSFPNLPLGALYTHKSGTDLTLEEKGKFRASFLLRSYIKNNEEYVETHPTYLSDDMRLNINPFEWNPKVTWIEDHSSYDDSSLKSTYRLNVAKFSDYNESEQKEPHKVEAGEDSKNTFKSGKKTYLQDMRQWRFYDSKVEGKLKFK